MRTLVLNAGHEPVQLIRWQRALCLVLLEKAEVLSEYGRKIRSVDRIFPLPGVIRLKIYIRSFHHRGLLRCTRKNVFARDDHRCQYCLRRFPVKELTLDHVLPRSRGGRDSWSNIVSACSGCNRRKGDRLPSECGMQLQRRPRQPGISDLLSRDEYSFFADWLE